MYTFKTYILTGVMAGFAVTVSAQDTYDAQNFTKSGLNGTARFVSMGGALGALGGDISVMGTNPAGTAIYKRSDAAVSASLLVGGDKAMDHGSTRMSLDQGGAVIAFDVENPSSEGLQYVNFGVNFAKKNKIGTNIMKATYILFSIFFSSISFLYSFLLILLL